MVYSLFEVRVGCFIFNDEQKILLLKNNQGTWGILGGHLEKGEQIEGTVFREVKEETNIAVEIVGCIGTRQLLHHPSFVVLFACKYKSGEIKLQKEEIKDYKWVELSELKNFDLTFPELSKEAEEAKKLVFLS